MTKQDFPVLYSFRRCPYAIRARLALAAAGITCELREVKLSNKPTAMLSISGKGTVPVLELPTGEVIDESLEVMRWALNQNDPEKWLDTDPSVSESLIQENDGYFKTQLDKYKYHVRFPGKTQLDYRLEAEEFVEKIERALEQNKGRGLLRETKGFADIAIFPFIRQFSRVDFDWFKRSRYRATVLWLETIEATSLFKNIMLKYEPWQESRGNSYEFP